MMYETVPIQYLDYFLEQGFSGRIIDLRSEEAYEKAHIRGAENYPYNELMNDPLALANENILLFYCSRGSESMLACNFFSRLGYRVVNVANGLNLYRGRYLESNL